MSTYGESSNLVSVPDNGENIAAPHAQQQQQQQTDVETHSNHVNEDPAVETTESVITNPADAYNEHLAESAVAAARRREFNDTAVRDKRRVYIGNLHHKVLVNELKDCFSEYRVTNVIIKKIKDGVRPNGAPFIKNSGYAFMDFDTREECIRAMKEAEGMEIRGRKIYIKLAVPDELRKRTERPERTEQPRSSQSLKSERSEAPPRSEVSKSETPEDLADTQVDSSSSPNVVVVPSSTFDLYISNLPRNTTSRSIHEFFAAYAPAWVQIKKREVFSEAQQKSMLVSRGFAFVGFNNAEMRDNAVRDLNATEMGDRIVHVMVAREKVYTNGRTIGDRTARERPARDGE